MTVTVLETAKGPIALRPEREDDASFLYELFRSHTLPGFASMPVDEAMKESLVRMQFRAQTGSYRAGFPRGLFAVLEQDGVPIGRLVWDEKDGVAYIVDLALMPGSRGGGIGTAFMTALLAWAGSGVRWYGRWCCTRMWRRCGCASVLGWCMTATRA